MFTLSSNFEAQQNIKRNLESEKYAKMVSLLVCIRELIENGFSISKLKEMYDAKEVCRFSNSSSFPDSKTITKCIDVISSDVSNIVSSDDKVLYDYIGVIINKYNLSDMNHLINKLNELMTNTDVINQLINDINTAYQCQKVSDINSLITFVRELVNNMASYSTLQNNNNALFTNLNATLAENASLKAENEQLKQRLIALGQAV